MLKGYDLYLELKNLTMSFKRALWTLFFMLFIAFSHAQFGIIPKASTYGFGADLGYRLNDKLLLKAGYDSFSFNFDTTLDQESVIVGLNGAIENASLGAYVDYQLAGKLYLSVGVIDGGLSSTVSGRSLSDYQWGDVTIPSSQLGTLTFNVAPKNSLLPYVGLGLGKLLNGEKTINFALEVGAINLGGSDVDVAATGAFAPSASNSAFYQQENLNAIFDLLQWYPIVKFNLAINLIK
jgi:hypothetical protein